MIIFEWIIVVDSVWDVNKQLGDDLETLLRFNHRECDLTKMEWM